MLDKGYHDNRLLARLAKKGVRTYIPERRQKSRCWTDKPAAYEAAFRANRRRVRGNKGRQLNRWRSERCERTFAHVCETGGGRRAWLRGQTNVSKVHTLKCAAYNLGLLLRKVWGLSKLAERGRGSGGFVFRAFGSMDTGSGNGWPAPTNPVVTWWVGGYRLLLVIASANRGIQSIREICQKRHLLTGC